MVEQQGEDTEAIQLRDLEKALGEQARKAGRDVDVPAAIAAALAEFATATVRSFVPVFVERQVRQQLGLPRADNDL